MIDYTLVARFQVPGFGNTQFRVLYGGPPVAGLNNPPPGVFVFQRLEFDEIGGERWTPLSGDNSRVAENTPLGFLLKNRLVPDK